MCVPLEKKKTLLYLFETNESAKKGHTPHTISHQESEKLCTHNFII